MLHYSDAVTTLLLLLCGRALVMLLLALLALCNLTLGIIRYSRVSSNEAAAFAFRLNQLLRPGSVVFFRDFSTDDWLARYFQPASQWQPADSSGAIDAELRTGRPVGLETTAADHFSAAEAAWFQDRTRTAEGREWNQRNRRIRGVRLSAP